MQEFLNQLLNRVNTTHYPIPVIQIKGRHTTEVAIKKVKKIETILDTLLSLFPHLKTQLDEIRQTALLILTDETYSSMVEKTNTLRLLLHRLETIQKMAQSQSKEFFWLSFLRTPPINMPNEHIHANIALKTLTEILIDAFKINESLKTICLTDLAIEVLETLGVPSPFHPSLPLLLEPLKGKKHVLNLQIQNNLLTENDFEYLAEFIQKTPIQTLNILNNQIDQKIIEYIQNALIYPETPKSTSKHILLFVDALDKHRNLVCFYCSDETIKINNLISHKNLVSAFFKPNKFYTEILQQRRNNPHANIQKTLNDFFLAVEASPWSDERKAFITTELAISLMKLEGLSSDCPITIEQYKSNLKMPSLEINWLIQVGLTEPFLKRMIYLNHPDHLIAMVRRLYAPKGELFLSISPKVEKLLIEHPSLCLITEEEAKTYQAALSTLFPNFKNFDLTQPEDFKNFFKTILYFMNQEKGHYSLNFFGKETIDINIWMTILGARYELLKAGIIPLPEWERKNNELEIYNELNASLDFGIENLKNFSMI